MIDLITCPQWHARQPRSPIQVIGRSSEVIFHHTAGHHREISGPQNESFEEACRYAQDIQHLHMDINGWQDSGHNFLVTRGGQILQGRWLTVSAIEAGHMVASAHCPGKNSQIGVEHEHLGIELMTPAQREASALLMAWIARCYRRSTPLPISPHRKYYPTACPGNLKSEIPKVYALAQDILTNGGL